MPRWRCAQRRSSGPRTHEIRRGALFRGTKFAAGDLSSTSEGRARSFQPHAVNSLACLFCGSGIPEIVYPALAEEARITCDIPR
jgi:hypothetical protein